MLEGDFKRDNVGEKERGNEGGLRKDGNEVRGVK
jgi:hypothetical protein